MNGRSGPIAIADSPLVARLAPSPNFGVRRGGRGIDMIVLHYTGCPSAEAAELWMCAAESQVSAHYLVEEDGTVVQLVAEEARRQAQPLRQGERGNNKAGSPAAREV